MRVWVLMFLGLAAAPSWADTQFRVKSMTRNEASPAKGMCDIRLQVDEEVEVAIRGDMVSIRTIRGREGRDDGSECNMPLPNHEVRDFNFDVKDSRNEIKLLEKPSARNGYAVIVHIHDTDGGYGRYRFRLNWAADPRTEAAFSWNNAAHYGSRGSGTAVMNESDTRQLSDASLDIDRAGHASIKFRSDRGGSVVFNGYVLDREGDRLKIDAATEDRRLHGTMWVTVNGPESIREIALNATDGQDHLIVQWERK